MRVQKMMKTKRRPLSLTARVMIFVALAIGVSLVLIGNLVLNTVERHFAEQDAGELAVINKAVIQALQSDDDPLQLPDKLSRAVSGHHGVYFQVLGSRGELIFRTAGSDFASAITAMPPVERIHADNLITWNTDGNTYRGVVTQFNNADREYRIATAIDMDFHLRFLQGFRRSLWLIMMLTGGVTLLAAWFGVHQGHAPLRGFSDNMRDMQADRLHVRLDLVSLPLELQELATAFNQMIGRLEDSFTRLSHFSADIAHELRTPLTNLITQTQVTLGKARTLEEYRELLYSNLEEQERLAKMVNDMLWLAKSDHGLLKPIQVPLNLAREVQELFDFFEALAEEKHIQMALEGKVPTVSGDRAMVRRAISNLLSNAIRHTPAGEWVRVQLNIAENETVSLSVINPGPGIPPEHLPRVFDRFYRADPSRTRQSDGAGLGLAIVRSIVEAHGGRVEVFSDRHITTFTLHFMARR
jgi:two-component system, OmpR family, heavy metal sensor histidine kinase CusS